MLAELKNAILEGLIFLGSEGDGDDEQIVVEPLVEDY